MNQMNFFYQIQGLYVNLFLIVTMFNGKKTQNIENLKTKQLYTQM